MKNIVLILFFAVFGYLSNIVSQEVYYLKNKDKISFFLRNIKTGSLKISTYLSLLRYNKKIVSNGNGCQDLIVEFSIAEKGFLAALSEVKLNYENSEKQKIEKFYTLIFE